MAPDTTPPGHLSAKAVRRHAAVRQHAATQLRAKARARTVKALTSWPAIVVSAVVAALIVAAVTR
ncbi:hypothetical protein OOJ91_12445 [Micromonospora lupini]|uniref:hypothetical protein n=1 Tax=Micromonospora lupini TaxID=285679 RepID=UPI00224D103A|nr:hypothetical protein [Micromonospora lupini]MCX5066689.1 hypothetical protein [Micromonospora lupini]